MYISIIFSGVKWKETNDEKEQQSIIFLNLKFVFYNNSSRLYDRYFDYFIFILIKFYFLTPISYL